MDRAWFGCCPSRRIPSNDYGIPMCNSNDITCSPVGLPQAARRWKQMQTYAPKWRECLHFKITWAQISSPWFGHFCPTEMFHRCFDFGFHDQIAASKSTTRQKGCMLIRACQNTSWDQGAVSIRKTVLPGMAIPMLKIRRPNGRLIFNMEITIRR